MPKAKEVKYPTMLLARVVNPGTDDAYMVTGTDASEVDDTINDSALASNVARYVLAGTGVIHNVAPRYVEDEKA